MHTSPRKVFQLQGSNRPTLLAEFSPLINYTDVDKVVLCWWEFLASMDSSKDMDNFH